MDEQAAGQSQAQDTALGQHDLEHSVAAKSAATQDSVMRITVIIPTTAYFQSGLRDFTMNIVRNLSGFSEQWAFRFQSVMDELVNNAIEFGSAPGSDIKITFVSKKKERVEIFVEDTGTGSVKIDPNELTKLVEERKVLDPTQITTIRGRGLPQIVANWTDSLEFTKNEKGGITSHVVKNYEE